MTQFQNEEQLERKAKIRQTQLDMFALQSDKANLTRKQKLLEDEIRKMKIDLGHLKADLEVKIKDLSLLEKKIAEIDEELTHTKKQMNTLK